MRAVTWQGRRNVTVGDPADPSLEKFRVVA